jgi:cell division protein FtsQ
VIRLVVAILLLVMAGLAVSLVSALDRPITKIRIKGDLNAAERSQVRETLTLTVDGGLLSIDLPQIVSSLEALSWPRAVKVRRVWPDALTIELNKAVVVAAWNDDYLTSEGQIVELAMAVPELVQFQCDHTEPQAALDLYQRLQREVGMADLQIASLRENELGEWTLTLTNGIALNIGVSELSERVHRFVSVYRTELADRIDEVAGVDARYASGIAVSWRDTNGNVSGGSVTHDLALSVAANNTRAKDGFR